jgi:hypothetical protein
MIRFCLRRALRRFQRRYDYDTGYLREMVDQDLRGLVRLGGVTRFAEYRFGLPAGPYFAAKLIATRAADCGACLRLAVDMAAEEGVSPDSLAAILAPGPADPDLRLAANFAEAVLGQSPDLAELAKAVTDRWGAQGRTGLAAAIAVGQFFPLFKRALGHAETCAIPSAALRRSA